MPISTRPSRPAVSPRRHARHGRRALWPRLAHWRGRQASTFPDTIPCLPCRSSTPALGTFTLPRGGICRPSRAGTRQRGSRRNGMAEQAAVRRGARVARREKWEEGNDAGPGGTRRGGQGGQVRMHAGWDGCVWHRAWAGGVGIFRIYPFGPNQVGGCTLACPMIDVAVQRNGAARPRPVQGDAASLQSAQDSARGFASTGATGRGP